METTLDQQTKLHVEEREQLSKRIEDLTQQNTVLHEEAEKLAAKVLTLQEQGRKDDTSTVTIATVSTDTSSESTDQLWEIIR